MDRNIENLKLRFATILKRVINACKKEGYNLRPYCTKRDVWEQARLYRQSRTWTEIKEMMCRLEEEGGTFLSKVILEVGPQYGRWVTNAPPGFSWHQYGEACDLFVQENYKAIWNPTHPGYLSLHENSKKRGLTTLESINDPNHCQLKKHSPNFYYKVETMDKLMRSMYVK